MTRISVIGGTGYAGGHIVQEAVNRGHQVKSYSRSAPSTSAAGATYVEADVLSDGTLQSASVDADVLVCALAPRGPLAGRMRQVVADLAALANQRGIPLGVVGGAGSLRIGNDGPLVKDTADFPPEFKAEAEEMAAILEDLRSSDAELDWFYVSPAGGFGPWASGTAMKKYRVGGDQLLVDNDGISAISGADLAHAVLNEIQSPANRGRRFTVAY